MKGLGCVDCAKIIGPGPGYWIPGLKFNIWRMVPNSLEAAGKMSKMAVEDHLLFLLKGPTYVHI